MKTVAEQIFDTIIRDCFQAVLKPLGFKKKGNNFYRHLPDIGQIVNIQKSSFYSKEHISFTINTGLFIPEYWLTYYTYHNGKIPDYPTEAICAIRQRIGKLKYNIDKWFVIAVNTDIGELKKEMTENVVCYIIPYFERHKTKNDILQILQDDKVNLDNFTRLIIFGEYKHFDKAQLEYNSLNRTSIYLPI